MQRFVCKEEGKFVHLQQYSRAQTVTLPTGHTHAPGYVAHGSVTAVPLYKLAKIHFNQKNRNDVKFDLISHTMTSFFT